MEREEMVQQLILMGGSLTVRWNATADSEHLGMNGKN
jgi:hypothetical protein